MNTPICDFVKGYLEKNALRLHMPGHKGVPLLGFEPYDITEISGADSLYEADGIIAESEANASLLFGCKTFYSTEGSSQCIQAMLYLALLQKQTSNTAPRIAVGRNAHKALIHAAALLDLAIDWLYPATEEGYLSFPITPEQLEAYFAHTAERPIAVYLTTPDYLGNMVDIKPLAEICHRHDTLLLVDNAHGAYLKFLNHSLHPIDLGADLCCDSAHKTLPVLTGGAYLHMADRWKSALAPRAKHALSFFGSTSPSYLILQSLDAANPILTELRSRLTSFLPKVEKLKHTLTQYGYVFFGNEPLKLTIDAKRYGYTGTQLATQLESKNIFCEFSDPDFLVMMLTPEIGEEGLRRLWETLRDIPKRQPILTVAPTVGRPKRACSAREAMLSDSEDLPLSDCVGRVLARADLQCPPAVPIVACGEVIDHAAIACLQYYGITHCNVIKQ